MDMLVAGILIGVLISVVLMGLLLVSRVTGTLRVDNTSDPNEGPWFFLEVYRHRADSLSTNQYIILEVKREGYLTRE